MAGQIYAPGNAYLGNAEFNWWFDPEATKIVLRAAVPHFVIPLDCTNNVPLKQAVFDQIANHEPQTVITKLFAQAYGPTVFYAFYVDLLTWPVPVKFVHPPPTHNLDD